MKLNEFRQEFPQLSQSVYGKPLVYLDNAATSLRPRAVIDKWTELSQKYSANLHRAVHYTSSVATEEYETTRDEVAKYLNVERDEIVFTSGATAAINLVAFALGEGFINQGDELLISEAEHHSNLIPWQMMCKRERAMLKKLPVDEDGRINLDQLKSLLTYRTKFVSLAHVSNVLGLVNPIKEIVELCHENNCKVLIDGAQGIVHEKVDLKELDCDFYVFSGHKIFAAPGTGVLYAKKYLLDAMSPYMGGGEMVDTVTFKEATYAPAPLKFEAGTQNFASIPTLKPALQILSLSLTDEFKSNTESIIHFMTDQLNHIPGLRLYGIPSTDKVFNSKKIPLFAFHVEHVHHEDLALILDKMGIAVRSGQMCAEPLMDRYGVTGMLRASFAAYNTMEEAEYFISSLKKAISILAKG